MVDLSVAIVSWNVAPLLDRCLRSIYASLSQKVEKLGTSPPKSPRGQRPLGVSSTSCRPLTIEVIVVDNASTDGSAQLVRESHPQVQLIANPTNAGFARANNQAIAKSQGRFILLLNSDTEVLGDALARMVGYMEAHPEVGVLGPQLLNADGSVQPSRRRFPTLATAFVESTIVQPWCSQGRLLSRYYVRDVPEDLPQEVDWLVGACLMVKRQVVEEVGSLDEHFFMYSEEMDWCYRIKRKGWKVAYLPTAQVIHHEGKSSEQAVASRHIYFNSSKVYYFHKHFGHWQGEALRAFLLCTFVIQLLVESAKWLLGHKRRLRRERMGAYLAVLRSGLKTT